MQQVPPISLDILVAVVLSADIYLITRSEISHSVLGTSLVLTKVKFHSQ